MHGVGDGVEGLEVLLGEVVRRGVGAWEHPDLPGLPGLGVAGQPGGRAGVAALGLQRGAGQRQQVACLQWPPLCSKSRLQACSASHAAMLYPFCGLLLPLLCVAVTAEHCPCRPSLAWMLSSTSGRYASHLALLRPVHGITMSVNIVSFYVISYDYIYIYIHCSSGTPGRRPASRRGRWSGSLGRPAC